MTRRHLTALFVSTKFLGAVVLVAAWQAPRMPPLPFPPPTAPPQPMAPFVCDGTEEPCDPNKPWMRGRVEKFCGTAQMLEKMRKELGPERVILACACKHTCDPKNEHASVTANRGWDSTCEARCNPNNCQCPRPCDT